MFILDSDFDRDGELSFVAAGPQFNDQTIAMIGGELVGGWTQRNDEIYLRETTYKHHKFYVDGAQVDLIQRLAHHHKASWDAGTDEDGDLYWEVSFDIEDFKEKLGTFDGIDGENYPDKDRYCIGCRGGHRHFYNTIQREYECSNCGLLALDER